MGGASTSSYQVEGGISNNDWDFLQEMKRLRKDFKDNQLSRLYKEFSQINLEPAFDAVKS